MKATSRVELQVDTIPFCRLRASVTNNRTMVAESTPLSLLLKTKVQTRTSVTNFVVCMCVITYSRMVFGCRVWLDTKWHYAFLPESTSPLLTGDSPFLDPSSRPPIRNSSFLPYDEDSRTSSKSVPRGSQFLFPPFRIFPNTKVYSHPSKVR
jgi:hypothetical protein